MTGLRHTFDADPSGRCLGGGVCNLGWLCAMEWRRRLAFVFLVMTIGEAEEPFQTAHLIKAVGFIGYSLAKLQGLTRFNVV